MDTKDRQKQYAQVIQKAWDDPKFKNDLIANPVEIMEAEFGRKLDIPADKTLIVQDYQSGVEMDQSDSSKIYFTIPKRGDSVDFELADEQLDNVAGGFTIQFHYGPNCERNGYSIHITI